MAKEKKQEKKSKASIDIDFGLGGLFKGIEKIIDIAAELKEAGGEIKKEGEIDLSNLKEGMKGVFGFSVKTVVGGKPIVEPFGNIKKTPKGPTVEEAREPIVDIFDEKEEVVVMAEMPGVKQEDIKINFPPEAGSPSAKKVDILIISAQSGDRKYHKEVLLPAKVLAENLSSSYKNGILEVRIKK